MNTSLESVREDVKFALTKQPGEGCAAIDGDGHTIYKLSFFARTIPPAWLDEIAEKLYRAHELGGCDKGGPGPFKGVYALDFHQWVAWSVVKKVDPTFHFYDDYGNAIRISTDRKLPTHFLKTI